LKRPLKKISSVVIGRTLKAVYDHSIDYIIYPIILIEFGFWSGLIIMICVTAAENLAMLLLYSKMKIDWLGYEYVHQLKRWETDGNYLKRVVGILLRKSDVFIFILLSTLRDSFETTAYFQQDVKRGKGRLAVIFVASLVLGNLYWSLGIELLINSWLREFIQ